MVTRTPLKYMYIACLVYYLAVGYISKLFTPNRVSRLIKQFLRVNTSNSGLPSSPQLSRYTD